MIASYGGIRWASPSYLWVMPVIIVIILCYLYRQYKIRVAVRAFAGKWYPSIIQNFILSREYVKALLFGIALIFLNGALLRPQWHEQAHTVVQNGRDILIALDISRSMLATDCHPNRLAYARTKIKQLLTKLPSERVGLILFSGSACMQCPLTTDYSAFTMFLDQVDAETISSGSTALDAAIEQALRAFQSAPERKNKLLVIFTDGEDFSTNLSHLKKEAQEQGLRIFTMGAGTHEGAPIPLYDGEGNQIGHQKDAKGKVVISQLNEGILHSLATDVGGTYILCTKDATDVHKLIERIIRFEKERFEDKQIAQFDDKYHYFVLVSLCCLLLEWIL